MKDNLTSSIHLFSINFFPNSKEDPISTLIVFINTDIAIIPDNEIQLRDRKLTEEPHLGGDTELEGLTGGLVLTSVEVAE